MARQAPEPVTATLPADLLRAVLERARSLIVGVRPDGTWFPLSQTVPELLGGATDDRALVRLVHPEDQAAAQRLYDQASARERVTDPADLRVRSASGRWITLETVAAGLLGDPRAGVVVFYGRDVTVQRETERALRIAQRDLEAQNAELAELAEMKNEFVAIVSHEMRSPLTAVVSFSHLLADPEQGPLSPRQLEFVEVIDRNAVRLLRLIDDLLLLTRIESGGLPLQLSIGSPAELVRTAAADHALAADAADVKIDCEVTEGPFAEYDEVRLHQVLSNVLGNALKFSVTGGTVRVRAHPALGGGGWAIEVADHGIGIPEVEIDKLFSPFVRGSNAGRRGVPGTGLGLVVSRAIIDMHGGTLAVESTEGEGTTVRIHLPLRPP
ncbi:MAG: domain S-box [Actinomycetia bacterium]|nr:domain S-box [Actinomycetes bacterium]